MSKRKADLPHWNDADLRRLHNPFDDVPHWTLNNYEVELRILISAANKEIVRLQSVHALVTEAIRNSDPKKLVVADHAIVRYLERYKGFNFDEIVDEIIEKVANGDPEVAVRDCVIVTVLPEGSETSDKPR